MYYYTVIKHEGHPRIRGKCRKQVPQRSIFYISRVFSNVRSVLPQCKTQLRLLHLLYDIKVMWQKTIKHAFSVFYTLIAYWNILAEKWRVILIATNSTTVSQNRETLAGCPHDKQPTTVSKITSCPDLCPDFKNFNKMKCFPMNKENYFWVGNEKVTSESRN